MRTLIDRFNTYMKIVSAEKTASSEQLVYIHLLNIDNALLWREWFGCSDRRLLSLTGFESMRTITAAKNKLKQKGLIEFKTGTKKTTMYKLNDVSSSADGSSVS